MPYTNISEVPKALVTAGLNLAQANEWAKIFDDSKSAATAWMQIRKKYRKLADGNWVKRSK